ncbi:MAG: spermidine synthase [Novosphingobium sp. 12-64-8]|nr:MAG: spermidine synthase [Novosphingobium sp. 12-64-8]
MIARELIDTARVPRGEDMHLYRHDGDFMIVLGNNELMNSRLSGSEIELATQTIARLKGRPHIRLLIGGYGMGFTLRAALKVLPADAKVVVVELVEEIIDWARGPMAELAAGCLDDPRVELVMGDVVEEIANSPGQYDAILLDVDNGPDGLTRRDNNKLYSMRGLRASKDALTAGGVLAIWSAAQDKAFTQKLRDTHFEVDEVRVPARSNGKGPKHTIWFATK